MSNQITTKKNMTPPPKKSEIIEAMAIIERNKLIEKQPKTIERFNKAEKAIDEWMDKNFKKLVKLAEFNGHSNYGMGETRISFSVKEEYLPSQLKKLQDEYNESSKDRMYHRDIPSLNQMKNIIRDKLNGSTDGRVASLVNDPEFKKTAQAALEAASK